MISNWRIFSAVLGAIIIGTSVYADMMPIQPADNQPIKSSGIFSDQKAHQQTGLSGFSNYLSNADVNLSTLKLYQERISELSNTPPEILPPKISTKRLGSLNLFLSTLISLSLCSSVHWMKKHSLGIIPEWYHSGGPHQIGHSFAVTPDFLRTAPALHFVLPVYNVEDSIPPYRLRTIVSLWRKSQFTPTVLASRAPPNMS